MPPDPADAEIGVRVAEHTLSSLPALLDAVRALKDDLGLPVQVVRSDRVASWDHLFMAAVHAGRAIRDGRARATDPAVEFLLYAACDRQIHRAVEALGVRPDGRSELLFVALGRIGQDRFREALARAGLPEGAPWERAGAPTDRTAGDAAAEWWQARLGVHDAPAVEGALLARMALLALDRV